MLLQRSTKALWICIPLFLSMPAFGAGKSTQKVPSQPHQTYLLIKGLAKEDLKKPFGKSILKNMPVDPDDAKHGIPYDLRADFDECGSNEFFISTSWNKYRDKSLLYLLTNLAIDVATWQTYLKAIGYPESVFQPAVSEFEEKILSRIDKLTKSELEEIYSGSKKIIKPDEDHENAFGPFEKAYRQEARALASKLNDYRTQTKAKTPEISVGGGECGAGGLSVHIVTNPRGGFISIIPVFFYKLCKAQNLNVDDPNSCDRWREIHDGFQADISGDYRYRARWSDGTTREGTLPFSTSHMDGKKTVVIRKYPEH